MSAHCQIYHRPTALCLALALLLALGAVPALAAGALGEVAFGETFEPACARLTGSVVPDGPLGGSAAEPPAPEERLLVDLAALPASELEIRYLVEGELYVAERVDLAAAERPREIDLDEAMSDERARRADGPRVLELLTLRADVLRRLRAMSGAGREVRVELFAGGELVDDVSLRGLAERSARLRDAGARHVVVAPEISGPGAFFEPVAASESSGSGCGSCGPTIPCDSIGPYDDGKGDCVECWEIGDCDPGPCDCETVLSEYWGSWYVTNVNYLGPVGCIDWAHPRSDELGRYAQVTYRRDRIRNSYVCPNCPACNGCYTQQTVIGYETQVVNCWVPQQFQSCYPGLQTVHPSSVCP